MPHTSSQPTPPASPAPAMATPTLTTTQVIVIFVLVLGAIVALTITLAFHYPAGSDATSVLGVVLPALTAIIGVVAGGGAGVAVGAAGKTAVQQDLARATITAQQAATEWQTLQGHLGFVLPELKRDMVSPAGVVGYTQAEQAMPTAAPLDLDGITASMARLGALLKSA